MGIMNLNRWHIVEGLGMGVAALLAGYATNNLVASLPIATSAFVLGLQGAYTRKQVLSSVSAAVDQAIQAQTSATPPAVPTLEALLQAALQEQAAKKGGG
jgi:hypothetical protein